jgi:hypothetical protein
MTFDGLTFKHERFDVPYRYPYHLGLFMAVNAIPGCYAVIDGPDCLYTTCARPCSTPAPATGSSRR